MIFFPVPTTLSLLLLLLLLHAIQEAFPDRSSEKGGDRLGQVVLTRPRARDEQVIRRADRHGDVPFDRLAQRRRLLRRRKVIGHHGGGCCRCCQTRRRRRIEKVT